MSDERVIDYLRQRGHVTPPHDLVARVMAAIDAPPVIPSRFSPFMPAFVAMGAMAVIAVLAFLIGQGPNIGPGPSPATSSPTPSASVEPTIDDLGVALLDAVDILQAAPGVEGRQQVEIDGTIGSATWFDWRPNGDQVIVQRQDLDVTETGWWMVPDGAPPATGQRIYTNIQVVIGDELFFTNEAGDWQVAANDDGFPQGAIGPAILDGSILPWRPLDGVATWLPDPSDVRVERDDLPDGGVEWELEFQWSGTPLIQHWTIAPGGELRSWILEREDRLVDPDGDFIANVTHASLHFTISNGDPIERPDLDAAPDPTPFGLPEDFPLGAGQAEAEIDYRAYVEDVLDVLETHHWNSDNIDWAVARSAALDGLAEELSADQAYSRIQRAVQTFDSFSTNFIRPRDVPPDGIGDGGGPVQLPGADRIGGVGHVTLPPLEGGGEDDLLEYLGAAREEMAAVEAPSAACGWVVDLRDYDGGAWGPPLTAVRGFLGEGRVVTFGSTAGDWWLEIASDGALTVGGFDDPAFPGSPYFDGVESDEDVSGVITGDTPFTPSAGDAPVAVLVGNGTAHGGEQTLVAFLGRPDTRIFGGPTRGMPIVAPNLHLVDGAVVRLPIWVPVDREGRRYTTNILPDEVTGDTRASGTDAVLDAALQWLESQAGCS